MKSTHAVEKAGASRPAGAGRAGDSLWRLGRRGGRSGWEPRHRDEDELNGGIRARPSLPPARHFVISANDFAGSPGYSTASSNRLAASENRFAGLRSHFVMSPDRFVKSGASFVIS